MICRVSPYFCTVPTVDMDEDVAAERQRIEAGANDPVVVTSMSKVCFFVCEELRNPLQVN